MQQPDVLRRINALLVGVAFVLLGTVLFRSASAWTSYRRTQQTLTPFQQHVVNQSMVGEPLASSTRLQSQIAGTGFLQEHEPAPQFTSRLTAIIGDEAFFDGRQSARVGDKVNSAVVKQIRADSVEVDFQGRLITLRVEGGSN